MSVELAKTPSFRLDGKRALVTGAGRGIGLAAASALADAGAQGEQGPRILRGGRHRGVDDACGVFDLGKRQHARTLG